MSTSSRFPTDITNADRECFQKAMQDVRKLSANKINLQHQHKNKIHDDIQKLSEKKDSYKFELSIRNVNDNFTEIITENEILFFAKSGLQHKLLSQFRQGKIRPAAAYDLHGMTVNTAKDSTENFIHHAFVQNFRCVKIIHGKGKILKNYLNHWLKQFESVLAFCSALSQDGGTGAVYVLLKRRFK